MQRKFIEGYRQGSWTVIERTVGNKALLRCDCGYEGRRFVSHLSNRKSMQCKNCVVTTGLHKTYLLVLRGASKRGIKWALSEEEWSSLSQKNCFYCDQPPSNMISTYKYLYSGIDRIDSALGYTIDNVVPACSICNRSKSSMSYADFMAWIEKVYLGNKTVS